MSSWSKIGETWSARFSYKKPDGTYAQKRFSFPGLNKRQAMNEFARLIVDYEANRLSMTLAKLLDIWIEHKKHSISYRTLVDYSRMIKYHSKSKIGNMPIELLTTNTIQQYIDSMSVKGLSPKTIKQRYLTIHQPLEFAVKSEYIRDNPCKHVSLPKARKPAINIIPPEKLDRLIKEIDKSIYRVPLLILFNTAMRRGEVCALQWQDIGFNERTITVSKSLYLFKGKWIPKQTKSYKTRVIAMNDLLFDLLQEEAKNKKSKLWVCPSIYGEVLSANTLYKTYSNIAKQVGVSTKLHDIRHTVITMMIQNNINFKIVSEIAGHSSIQMTLDRYTHLNTDNQREAINVLANIYQKSK